MKNSLIELKTKLSDYQNKIQSEIDDLVQIAIEKDDFDVSDVVVDFGDVIYESIDNLIDFIEDEI